MDLNEMISIIREFFPENAVELSESLELLRGFYATISDSLVR